MEETASITHHSSLAVSWNRFIHFTSQWRYILLFAAVRKRFCQNPAAMLSNMFFGQDVLSLQPRSKAMLREKNGVTNLDIMQMSWSVSNSRVPVVPKEVWGQHMPYLNAESLSIKSCIINSMEVPKLSPRPHPSSPSLFLWGVTWRQ